MVRPKDATFSKEATLAVEWREDTEGDLSSSSQHFCLRKQGRRMGLSFGTNERMLGLKIWKDPRFFLLLCVVKLRARFLSIITFVVHYELPTLPTSNR